MREILFRGKRLHDNKWIYGNFVSDCEGNPHLIEPRFFCEDGHHLQYEDNTDTPGFIIPETVGQYTGLTDKNGVRIFEGDIVRTKYGRICKVVWFAPQLCWDLYPLESKSNAPDTYDLFKSENLEVIGNIYDNPEILKEGNELYV